MGEGETMRKEAIVFLLGLLAIGWLVFFSPLVASLRVGLRQDVTQVYIWGRYKGEWYQLVAEAVEQWKCEKANAALQPKYPDFELICLEVGLTPLELMDF